ncbi:hypothetical protein [Elizabethkingia anophelis]|uniref:hypothetical protein n=1 Tax=Elizabethkingia anophelis TaxID=1117645 RepID=UPI00301DB404
MKIIIATIFLITNIFGCNGSKKTTKENSIISKTYHKTGKTDTDTLWVSQNDSTVFKREEMFINRPCSNPEFAIRYDLIKPKNNAYYFIYDENHQLVLEGKYEANYIFEGIATGKGDFYNSKNYDYNDNGDLLAISYMQDGRHTKTETFGSDGKIEKIFYKNKKSGDTEKLEFYKNGKLKKTRIYTAFDTYYTINADE